MACCIEITVWPIVRSWMRHLDIPIYIQLLQFHVRISYVGNSTFSIRTWAVANMIYESTVQVWETDALGAEALSESESMSPMDEQSMAQRDELFQSLVQAHGTRLYRLSSRTSAIPAMPRIWPSRPSWKRFDPIARSRGSPSCPPGCMASP